MQRVTPKRKYSSSPVLKQHSTTHAYMRSEYNRLMPTTEPAVNIPGMSSYRDLFAKAIHDVHRLRNLAPGEIQERAYAFFDFAVTAWHVLDWLANADTLTESQRKSAVLLRRQPTQWLAVCRDTCNSAKHLVLNRPRSARDATVDTSKTFNVVITDNVLGEHPEMEKAVTQVIKVDDGNGVRVLDTEFAELVIKELRALARDNHFQLE